MIDVAIVTDQSLINIDGHLREKDADGCHLLEELQKQEINAGALAWDDPKVDWSGVKMAIISSTWNYQQQPDAFISWLVRVQQTNCQIVNDPALLQWNVNKQYLLQLEQEGISIPKTHILQSTKEIFDPKWVAKFGSAGVVIKPCISASAEGTRLIKNFSEFIQQEHPADLRDNRSVLLQPFLKSIQEYGERSLIFIEGIYSHAFNKTPAKGDFRVQREFGGTQELFQPTKEEMNFAERVINKISQLQAQPVYARVDICHDNQNQLVLMELEMIEPELWLSASTKATNQLIDFFLRMIDGAELP